MRERRIFIAGATGAVGRTVLGISGDDSALIPHVRPQTARTHPPPARAAVLELGDTSALRPLLESCTTVLQLIGTARKRFSSGDTYQSSDVGTTRQLVLAAGPAGVDHLILLSSTGAGRPLGAYLKAKAQAEALVVESGIPFTVFRPSAFVGEGHRPPPGLGLVSRAPGLSRLRPIAIEDLARAIVRVARQRSHLGEVLEGERLWRVVAESSLRS